MESKDLVLLLLIPLLLVGLIVYTNNAPQITGMATSQQEENNVIGYYSVMPSFKAAINYNLEDYAKINKIINNLIDCYGKGNKIDKCIKEAENKDNSFEWLLGCNKGAEKVIYDFAEFYQDCFDSDDDNCLCKKNLLLSNEEIQKSGLANNAYTMMLVQNIPLQNIEIKMLEPNIDLSHNIKLNGRSVWYPYRYVISYTQDDAVLNMIFRDELAGIDYKEAFSQKSDITLYKHEINGLKSVDFVEQQGNELIYPNRNSVQPSGIHDCELKPKNTLKFCVTKKGSKIMAYDKSDNVIKPRDIIYKFSVKIIE